MRFGPVNLILVSDKWYFRAWERGTKQLLAEAPVTRERAVKDFIEIFEE